MLMFNDISRAYMHARTASDMCVELCDDKTEPGKEQRCRKRKGRCVGPGQQYETGSQK